ncbi:MAG: SprT family zinc-dependent metalloprotease [Pseudomonadota bacterium]
MPLLLSATSLKSSTILPFAYAIVRSARRRSISIEVAKAQVTVRAPFFVAALDLEKFVRKKSVWIQQKLAQQAQQIDVIPQRTYTTGSELPFLGQPLTLIISRQTQANVVQLGSQLLVALKSRSKLTEEEQARRLVSLWYQRQALYFLTLKTDAAARALGLTYSDLTIKVTRSKWGHCTARGAIQYNWHILLAPEPIVDYLVAHEVSHLRQHNHSPAFWQLVANLCPDYKKHRAWLKTNGFQLTL